MNEVDASRLQVDSYPGGIDAMAPRLGKTVEVLRKELSGAPTHKLGLVTAATISRLCNEVKSPHAAELINALSVDCGTLLCLPVIDMVLAQPSRGLSDLMRELADVAGAVTSAHADGQISDNERRTIEREALELMAQLQRLMACVRQQNEATRHGGAS